MGSMAITQGTTKRLGLIDPGISVFYDEDGMAWAQREYSFRKIDKAGKALASLAADDPARTSAVEIINNWRSCHSYPLQAVTMTLRNRARRIDTDALIAQRIKRLPSIALKLHDTPTMHLSNMQDIGGCRAVVDSPSQVADLVRLYAYQQREDSPSVRRTYDYIGSPKDDGYRSMHIVVEYASRADKHRVYNGQQIEIQIRTHQQHAWATAVETAEIFTDQALKSKIKKASKSWMRFFALMGSAIAATEGCPIVPDTPEKSEERTEELRGIETRERIVDQLEAWNATVGHLEVSRPAGADSYLLVLDIAQGELRIMPFMKRDSLWAYSAYTEEEKQAEGNPARQVVLVSVESLAALQRAYPNYYADTSVFIDAVREELALPPARSQVKGK